MLIVIQLQIVGASNPNLLSNIIMVEGIDHSQECIECGQLCDPIIPSCDYIYPIGFQCVLIIEEKLRIIVQQYCF